MIPMTSEAAPAAPPPVRRLVRPLLEMGIRRMSRYAASLSSASGFRGPERRVEVELLIFREHTQTIWYRRITGLIRAGEAPDETATRLAGARVDISPESGVLLHSTSWRYAPDGVLVLTYALVPEPDPHQAAVALRSSRIAYGPHAGAPSPLVVSFDEVAAHAARHLAFLLQTDPDIALALALQPALASALRAHAPATGGQLQAPCRWGPHR